MSDNNRLSIVIVDDRIIGYVYCIPMGVKFYTECFNSSGDIIYYNELVDFVRDAGVNVPEDEFILNVKGVTLTNLLVRKRNMKNIFRQYPFIKKATQRVLSQKCVGTL